MVLQELISPAAKEFVLKTTNRDLKSLLESRVQQLFDVDFEILPCDSNEVESDLNLEKYESLQWIRIVCEEHPELLDQAKVPCLKL
jgi:hypothetical protein